MPRKTKRKKKKTGREKAAPKKKTRRRCRSKTTKRLVKGLATEERALELREKGWSYRTIGAAMGLSPAGVHKAVTRAMEKTAARIATVADHVREIEIERLDRLQEAHWETATGKGKNRGQATDRVLKIMERRARLMGLDAPKKIDVAADVALKTHEQWLEELDD